MADLAAIMPPMLVDQAERSLMTFTAAHSDSMPLAINQDRIICYCDPRLREMLGYGWHEELVNGTTLVDVLLPQELRAWHAKVIAQWFAEPEILDMHSRGPLPIMTKRGSIYSALVKLVPFEPEEQGRRPLLDKPAFYKFAVAFVTLLPRSWDRYVNAAQFSATNMGPGRAPSHPPGSTAGGLPPIGSNSEARRISDPPYGMARPIEGRPPLHAGMDVQDSQGNRPGPWPYGGGGHPPRS